MKKLLTAAAASAIIITNTFSPLISCETNASSFFGPDYSTGLIEKCSLYCEASDYKLSLTAKTLAAIKTDSIGCKNTKVQYSDDCKNWKDESELGDILISGSKRHIIDHLAVEVEGGHYYRVTCLHYARAKDVTYTPDLPEPIFSYQDQEAENSSNAVYIPKRPVSTTTTTTTTTTTKTAAAVTTTATSAAVSSVFSAAMTVPTTASAHDPASGTAKTTHAASGSAVSSPAASSSPATGRRAPYADIAALITAAAAAVISRIKRRD